jgi:hypothetical protein
VTSFAPGAAAWYVGTALDGLVRVPFAAPGADRGRARKGSQASRLAGLEAVAAGRDDDEIPRPSVLRDLDSDEAGRRLAQPPNRLRGQPDLTSDSEPAPAVGARSASDRHDLPAKPLREPSCARALASRPALARSLRISVFNRGVPLLAKGSSLTRDAATSGRATARRYQSSDTEGAVPGPTDYGV